MLLSTHAAMAHAVVQSLPMATTYVCIVVVAVVWIYTASTPLVIHKVHTSLVAMLPGYHMTIFEPV